MSEIEAGATYIGTCNGTFTGVTSGCTYTLTGTYQFTFVAGSQTVNGIITVTNCNPNPGPFNVTGTRVGNSGVVCGLTTGKNGSGGTCTLSISLNRTANTTQTGSGPVVCTYCNVDPNTYNVISTCTSA